MDHLRNMTSMPNSELDYELGRSKQCILNHGIPVTTFASHLTMVKTTQTSSTRFQRFLVLLDQETNR